MAAYYIGVDIGGTSVKLGSFDTEGSLLDKWEIPTRKENSGDKILPDIAASLTERVKGEIKGIGLGVPGPVTEDGTVLKCANLGWDVFNVAKKVTELTGVDNVAVGNDATVAGLGELWQGGGRGFSDMVMVTLGTGVGGGIILNGKIVSGSKGAAGEIGHIKVEENEDDVCGCGGHGCLEQYASATGIVRMAKRFMKPDSTVSDCENLSAKKVFDAAKSGDSYCMEIVEKFGKYLGTALSNISCVIDPEVIVIGGGVSRAGQIILDVVEKWYQKQSMFALRNKVFRLAELGNDAGIFGCVKMVIDNRNED